MVLFEAPLWFVLPYLFVMGAVMGSFLTVCIHRFPQHEAFGDQLKSLGRPTFSICPSCGNRLRARDNLPIIGWLKLGGRCSFCRIWISPRYPLIELFNGLLFVVVYWCEVPAGYSATIADSCLYSQFLPEGLAGSTWLSPAASVHWRYAYHMILIEALVVATFIDFELRIIPDGSTLPAMAVGIVGAVCLGQVYLVPVWFQGPEFTGTLQSILPDSVHWLLIDSNVPLWIGAHPHWHGLAVSLAGFVVGGGIVWAVRLIGFWVLRAEAMGFGDVILMAMIGSFLGWQPMVVIFFIAPVFALVVVVASIAFRRQREIPYGPYLSLATLVLLLGWKTIWPVAERIFSLGPIIPMMAVITGILLVMCLFLVQMAKRMMGIALYPPDEYVIEWTSADQLAYYSSENVDVMQGQWRRETWQGAPAGRGTFHEEQWRRPSTNSGNQHWQRRE